MASPRITIDQLPSDDVVSGTEYLVVQDGATTKKLALSAAFAANGVQAHVADTTDAHMATAIGAASNGAVANGTNVQVQLGQLATALNTVTITANGNTTAITDHVGDTTDAHVASAIGTDNTGRVTIIGPQLDAQLDAADVALTNVVNQVATNTINFNGHIAAATDAHDASAVSVAPISGLVASDVQGALSVLYSAYSGVYRRTLNNQTGTSYTLAANDENRMVTLSNAGGITVTLPSDATAAFADGAEIDFLWLGVGQPVFAAGAGATVVSTPGLKLRARYSKATAKRIAPNSWVVYGDLAA